MNVDIAVIFLCLIVIMSVQNTMERFFFFQTQPFEVETPQKSVLPSSGAYGGLVMTMMITECFYHSSRIEKRQDLGRVRFARIGPLLIQLVLQELRNVTRTKRMLHHDTFNKNM